MKYIEPPESITTDGNGNECRIRVDSGVLPGSIISPYYDPMISKLIAYSSNSRNESIKALRGALDRYVIRGIEQNSSFILDVLRSKPFIEGETPTNFIDLHYPDGFVGVQLNSEERAELVAIAATVNLWRRDCLDLPPLPMNSTLTTDGGGEKVVVCLGGMHGSASIVHVKDSESGEILVEHIPKGTSESESESTTSDAKEDSLSTTSSHKVTINSIQYDPIDPVVEVEINGEQKAIQIQNEDNTGLFNVQYIGANLDCLVMSIDEYKLSRHMKEPTALDTSNLLLSPMPGTLVSYAVEDGDEVLVGQEICVVEAMKMQNVLRSARSGVIKKCHAEVGASLMTDEMIVEFDS